MSRAQNGSGVTDRTTDLSRQRGIPQLAVFAILGTVIADRVFKWIALTDWSQSPLQVAPGFELIFFLNPGVAFSLPLPAWGYYSLTIPLLSVLGWWFGVAFSSGRTVTATALLAILAGAVSNVADRVLYRGVIDFVRAWWLPVFNLADMLILIGAIVLAAWSGRVSKRVPGRHD